MRGRLAIPILLLAVVVAAPAAAEPPSRVEPLSAAERASALDRALRGRGGAARQRTAAGAAVAEPVQPGAREEVLRIERRQDSKEERAAGSERGADVYIYDYDANVTRHSVVRLPSGTLERDERLEGVQLPLTRGEIDRATRIALADSGVRDRIQRLFRERTGEILEDVGQLHSKAMVFSAESMPESVNELARVCGLHRCAQLLLFTTDHVTVEVIPIVDLSTGELVQVLDF